MTNERDVRRFDDVTLHRAVMDGDPEAFGELMRRADPIVRQQMWRAASGTGPVSSEALDETIAAFWCAILRGRMAALADWQPDSGARLATWIGLLAAASAADHAEEETRPDARLPARRLA